MTAQYIFLNARLANKLCRAPFVIWEGSPLPSPCAVAPCDCCTPATGRTRRRSGSVASGARGRGGRFRARRRARAGQLPASIAIAPARPAAGWMSPRRRRCSKGARAAQRSSRASRRESLLLERLVSGEMPPEDEDGQAAAATTDREEIRTAQSLDCRGRRLAQGSRARAARANGRSGEGQDVLVVPAGAATRRCLRQKHRDARANAIDAFIWQKLDAAGSAACRRQPIERTSAAAGISRCARPAAEHRGARCIPGRRFAAGL